MKFSILVAFLFVLAVANAYPSNSVSSSEPQRKTRSWFGSLKKIVTKFARKIYYWKDKCHGLECPDYELKKKTDNYELRCYSNYSWVGTQYVGESLTRKVRSEMFQRLFDYISGQNVDKVKIDMTVPVATDVLKRGNETRYAMLFFVPFEHQASPPKPTNAEVTIYRLPRTCVYVKTFSWYTSTEWVEKKVKELESALKKDGLTDFITSDTAYAYAGYDSPWTIPFLRHNEVWLVQK